MMNGIRAISIIKSMLATVVISLLTLLSPRVSAFRRPAFLSWKLARRPCYGSATTSSVAVSRSRAIASSTGSLFPHRLSRVYKVDRTPRSRNLASRATSHYNGNPQLALDNRSDPLVFGIPEDLQNYSYPFIDRHAETFDMFAINLQNNQGKTFVGLGSQLTGSGKTALGVNAVSVLRQPREAPGEEESVVEERLRRSLTLRDGLLMTDGILSLAKARPENETLVARALREFLIDELRSPNIVDELKEAVTVVVSLKSMDPRNYTSLSTLVSHAM